MQTLSFEYGLASSVCLSFAFRGAIEVIVKVSPYPFPLLSMASSSSSKERTQPLHPVTMFSSFVRSFVSVKNRGHYDQEEEFDVGLIERD